MEPKTERPKSLDLDSEDASIPSPSPKVSNANISKEITGSNKKEKLKTDYSAFIINLLEKPFHNPFSKKKIKIKNNNLIKKKISHNPTETNYTPRINNKTFNSRYPIKNDNISYSTNKERVSINNESERVVKKKLSPINLNNIKDNNIHITSYNTKNKSTLYNQSSLYNKRKNVIKKINNRSLKDKNAKILSKLYGYNKKYLFSNSKTLRKKSVLDIEKYQNRILKLSQRKLSREHLVKLYSELQTIKNNAELVKPLPPINYPALVIHSFKEVENRRKHIGNLYNEGKNYDNMDEYEKEMYEIKNSNNKKRVKIFRNKRMYKIYEVLPEYVVDVIFKKK